MKKHSNAVMPVNKEKRRERFWSQSNLIKTLMNGLFMILPIIIILFLLSLIFQLAFRLVEPLSSLLDKNAETHTLLTNFLALLILIAVIFIFGIVYSNRRGQYIFSKFEQRYLIQIPLYSTIKETIAQFSGIKDMPFSQVVLADVYGTGVLLTGFVTESTDNNMYTIFVPTAPNPMNGNIYHVPKEKLQFLDIEPEKAMKSIVGMGTGSSGLITAKHKKEH